jgi:hypothetical protein
MYEQTPQILTVQEGFFSLLDEYFASRPHLLQGGGGNSSRQAYPSPTSPPAPVRTASGGRSLPPPAPASNSRPPPIQSPPPGQNGNYEKPDMATRMVMSGLKIGSSGARKGLGMLANNQQAMDALGRAGAQGMIRSAQSGLGGGQQQQQQQETHSRTSPSFYPKDIERHRH